MWSTDVARASTSVKSSMQKISSLVPVGGVTFGYQNIGFQRGMAWNGTKSPNEEMTFATQKLETFQEQQHIAEY